jgi:hypothetical protein
MPWFELYETLRTLQASWEVIALTGGTAGMPEGQQEIRIVVRRRTEVLSG